MVKVFENTTHEYYIDGYLKENLDIAKQANRKDWDMIFIVDGYEGSGKSVMAQQLAKYCDPYMTLNNITFNPKQFKEGIKNAKQYTSIIYDEAYGGLSSKSALNHVNKSIVKMLTEIRQKNLFVFIVLPTFFDIVKYVALWRTRALIHVYSGEDFKRGYFAFYNIEKKKDLYINGKKFYSYSRPKPNFIGRFTDHYIVEKEDYKKKKIESTILEDENDDSFVYKLKTISREIKQEIANTLYNEKLGLTQQQIADILNVTYMTIYNYRKKYGINEEDNKDLLEI